MSQCQYLYHRGEFRLDQPQKQYAIYFPLCNEAGVKSAISPTLQGDMKLDQNRFALTPVSEDDLALNKTGRNCYLQIDDHPLWSVNGITAFQQMDKTDEVSMRAGFLWHEMTRLNTDLGIKTVSTTFVPQTLDHIELTETLLENISNKPITVTVTFAIPLYSRSADNIRDHRHVTSLLNRVTVSEGAITNCPTLSFDERGHLPNTLCYSVLAQSAPQLDVSHYYPSLHGFIGHGTLEWPDALTDNNYTASQYPVLNGTEVLGGMTFDTYTLAPAETLKFYTGIGIHATLEDLPRLKETYLNKAGFQAHFEENQRIWESKVNQIVYTTGDADFGEWMRWVNLQPILRRLYGCSFMPHHDYGRGGRGWRDLWQDCLALILQDEPGIEGLLYNNFAGVRIDGSNATIIGSAPGEFLADRNHLVRVWMDHGAWPLLSVMLYVHRTGDTQFLLKKQSYFKDSHTHYTKKIDAQFSEEQSFKQRTQKGEFYDGSLLEHLLLQNVIPFYNAGEHGSLRLEGADWNDGLDMARNRGESVAFTALYANNLLTLADLLDVLLKKNVISQLEVFEEFATLLTDIGIEALSIEARHERLNAFFASVEHQLSGNLVQLDINVVTRNLRQKADKLIQTVRHEEWLESQASLGWFNGYYDNDGQPLDSIEQPTMTLTGQVFTLMGATATDEQAKKMVKTTRQQLFKPELGGYLLNQDLEEVKLNMGRLFGFAYGHKENGAMFSHMNVMYGYALYERGFIEEGFELVNTLYKHCSQTDLSHIYPGVPEYIGPQGQGLYHYLTGSASWTILLVLEQMFGVKGLYGDLYLAPKLLPQQFDEHGEVHVTAPFYHRQLQIVYRSSGAKATTINSVRINGVHLDLHYGDASICIPRASLALDEPIVIECDLS